MNSENLKWTIAAYSIFILFINNTTSFLTIIEK